MKRNRESLPDRLPGMDWLALWILLSTWCAASGWILSACGLLDRAGYTLSLLLFVGSLYIARRHLKIFATRPAPLLRRTTFRGLPPKMWLVIVLLSFVGGILYHADNYDYLTYRFPRLLHWCWEHHWYWIPTPNDRQNISATGMEWMLTPLFVFFQTDRPFFLVNLASYLFLPTLIFAVFRQCGISGRVGWWWMWILPTGFCYSLQAGSMGNDMFAVVYLLAAFYYLFQARVTQLPRDIVLSGLALALLTGAKASNIPLVVPWLIVAWINRKLLWPACHPVALIFTALAGALASFLPIALCNIHYAGNYTGDPRNVHGVQVANPLVGVVGNTLEALAGNLTPPVWVHDFSWNLPVFLADYLRKGYPRFGLAQAPFQIEEVAGVGLGITLIAMWSVLAGIRYRLGPSPRRIPPVALGLAAGTVLAWAGYMSKMGSEAAPRLLSVYYVLGIGALLAVLPLDGKVVHRWLWKILAVAAFAIVFPLLILNPSRPFLPVAFAANILHAVHVPDSAIARLAQSYSTRASRYDGLSALRAAIPPAENTIGVVEGADDPDVSLWLPFGSRQVIEVTPHSDPAQLKSQDIRYAAVSENVLKYTYNLTVEELAKKWAMVVVREQKLIIETKRKTEVWYLLGPSPQVSFSSPGAT